MNYFNFYNNNLYDNNNDNNNNNITTTTNTDCNTDDTQPDLVPIPFNFILILLLVCLSALFSGLTLGLLGLDVVGLEIIIGGDNETVKKAAKDILPIRKRGNLLLCTLLLGNVATNSLLSILMANMTSGLIGFFTSTILIVLFGEIIPQATCSRHALFIGQKSLPLVKFFLGVFFIVAYPLSVVLDYFLGEEIGTIHSRQELIAMLKIHHRHEQLDQDTVNVMSGAIQYRDKKAEDVMTPISEAFMLSSADKLNAKTMSEIFKSGYSRIPVYGESRNDIVGLMLTKDMIFIDPEDEVPIVNFMNLFHRPFQMVWNDDKLGEVLKGLKQGHAHLAFVRGIKENGLKDNTYEIVGIITLEDVIEEILGEEIEDETDELPQSQQLGTRDRELARLILLTGRNTNTKLSFEEIQVISLHLTSNIPQFKNLVESCENNENGKKDYINEKIMKMLSKCKVMEITRQSNYDEITKNKPTQEDIIYKKGKITNTAALILNGKVSILAGKEEFYSELSSWSIIGLDGLSFNKKTEPYIPDFTAYISSEKVRILWITQTDINSLFEDNNENNLKDEKKKRKIMTINPNNNNNNSNNNNSNNNSNVNPLHSNYNSSFSEYEMGHISQETKSSINNGVGNYDTFHNNNTNNMGGTNGKSVTNRVHTKFGNQYESLDDNV